MTRILEPAPGSLLAETETAGQGPCSHLDAVSALQLFKQMYLRNSLFFHGLEFEDVHSLSVAGGGEEHAVHAESQGTDAHTPGDKVKGSELCRRPETLRVTSNLPEGLLPKATEKKSPITGTLSYWHFSHSSLVIVSKTFLREKCLKSNK